MGKLCFILAHWWLAYYFICTTTVIYFELRINASSTLLEGQTNEEGEKNKCSKVIFWQKVVFLCVAVFFTALTVLKLVGIAKESQRSAKLQLIASLIPIFEVLVILVPLGLSMIRLRNFQV